MSRYLISFDDGWMDFPDSDFDDVSKATHAVVDEAKKARVWIFGAGLQSQRATVVATDGSVTDGDFPETKAVLGGFCILEVATRDDAVSWAKKLAVSCRCTQEIRELMFDPES
jgi:hypothetical protein